MIDLLFIHVPRFSGGYKPFGECMTINLLPMGTLALADLAVRQGYRTEILHLGLEWIRTGTFSPAGHLAGRQVRVAALPLHWHQQSWDVLEAARCIKKEAPETWVVLGGATASFFHREIMASFPQVDAVIRGDAEQPLCALMQAVTQGGGFAPVPNLTWRDTNGIRENPLTYTAGAEDLERASYANLSLLRDGARYMRSMGLPLLWSKGLSEEENRKHLNLGYSIFFLNAGRGCSGNCTWCGGGSRAQRALNGRNGVLFRAPENVADTASEAAARGYDMLHLAFDPGPEAEEYYRDLFAVIRRRKLRMRCYFESFSLPSERFLKDFSGTFIPQGSAVALSPETGDEAVRARNKSFSFTNTSLMKTAAAAQGLGVTLDVFFAMGIPGETYSGLAKTAALRKDMQRRFNNIGRVWTSPISIEPASPWQIDPEAFGIVSERKTFDDFYRASAPGGSGPGYYIPDYMEGQRLDAQGFARLVNRERCRNHCSLHPSASRAARPFWGRMYCRYMRFKTRGYLG